MSAPVQDQEIQLGDGTVLAVRTTRPPASMAPRGSAVLVHGLASNARMWDACAAAAAGAGLTCVAPDLRGHGRSPALAAATAGLSPAQAGPYGTPTAADDVARLIARGRDDGTLTGPVVLAGQSWGGNVVLTAAARHPGLVDALALVDGGWLRFDPAETFERLWQRMAPAGWGGATWSEAQERIGGMVAGWGPHALPAIMANLTTDGDGLVRNILDLDAHEQILRSLHDADPRALYPAVTVPVLLAPAGGGPAASLVDEALAGLADPRLRRYDGAHHDLHLQHPERLAADLVEVLGIPSHGPLPGSESSPSTTHTHPPERS